MLNRSAATTPPRDSLQNAVDDHDKCLAEAVKRSQDLFYTTTGVHPWAHS